MKVLNSAPYLITANAAKNRYAKLKCSHKFTHALEPVRKRLVMFHDLHIIVRLKAEKDMRRNAQCSLTQKSKFGIYRALAVYYIIQNGI